MGTVSDLKDIDLDYIYEFMEGGISDEMPQEVADYLEMMDKVRGMRLRIDKWASKDAIVNHLIKIDGLSYYLANKLYNQTVEFFYCDSSISKQAWRNVYAEQMEKVIAFAISMMKDASDAAKVGRMILDMAKIRQLDQPDVEELPQELFERPFKLYTTNPEDLGLPGIDRRKLAQFIDNMEDLSEVEKDIIRREARILPLKVFPTDEENPRKSG